MPRKPAPHSPQLTADQQLYHHGYSRGYGKGYGSGLKVGEKDFRVWLCEELRTLACDVRLGLRHDLSPEGTIAAIMEMLKEGKPVPEAEL